MLKRLALALLLAATAMLAADVTGKWNATVETDGGSGNPKFVFVQSGESLTGTYEGLLGTAKITGTVKGDAIEFGFSASNDGEKIDVKYKGTVSGNKMKGKVDMGELANGTFTAEKQ
jgi:hypothetical protein